MIQGATVYAHMAAQEKIPRYLTYR